MQFLKVVLNLLNMSNETNYLSFKQVCLQLSFQNLNNLPLKLVGTKIKSIETHNNILNIFNFGTRVFFFEQNVCIK